jgi:competence protein ComEC
MLLSHDDNDHTGGAASVIQRLSVQRGLGSMPYRHTPTLPPWQACQAGMAWNWDGWHFELLFPDASDLAVAQSDNNRSCVLRVSALGQAAGNAVFLPGDLEQVGEQRLLARLPPEQRRATVLVAGHHGSRNASSPELLDALQPQLALVSAGYRNRFHHPNAAFLERLADRHIPWVNTAKDGALTVTLMPTGPLRLQRYRQSAGHYWQRP